MITEKVVINNASGLHARPASTFVSAAKKYESKITVLFKDKVINAKSIVNVLTAGIVAGSEIELQCDGADEEKAVKELVELIASGLGE